jgi:hypothetical protein
VNGHLVPVGDPSALAARIAAMADDPAGRDSVAAAGRRYFEDELSIRSAARRLDGLLRRIRPLDGAISAGGRCWTGSTVGTSAAAMFIVAAADAEKVVLEIDGKRLVIAIHHRVVQVELPPDKADVRVAIVEGDVELDRAIGVDPKG